MFTSAIRTVHDCQKKKAHSVTHVKQIDSIWWMWALSLFLLYLGLRTDAVLPSLMARVQRKWIPPWGDAWHPSLPAQWRYLVLSSHPLKTRAYTLWMGCDTMPFLEKGRCAPPEAPVNPGEVPGSVTFVGWDYLDGGQNFCCQPCFGLSFQAHHQAQTLWEAERNPAQKGVHHGLQEVLGTTCGVSREWGVAKRPEMLNGNLQALLGEDLCQNQPLG